MSDEELRILRAASEGRLRINKAGRYVITGEARPERRARERLQLRRFIGWQWGDEYDQPKITDLGRRVLSAASGNPANRGD